MQIMTAPTAPTSANEEITEIYGSVSVPLPLFDELLARTVEHAPRSATLFVIAGEVLMPRDDFSDLVTRADAWDLVRLAA